MKCAGAFFLCLAGCSAYASDYSWGQTRDGHWCLHIDENEMCLPSNAVLESFDATGANFRSSNDGQQAPLIYQYLTGDPEYLDEQLVGENVGFGPPATDILKGIQIVEHRQDYFSIFVLRISPTKAMTVAGFPRDRLRRIVENLVEQWSVETPPFTPPERCKSEYFFAACSPPEPQELIDLRRSIDSL